MADAFFILYSRNIRKFSRLYKSIVVKKVLPHKIVSFFAPNAPILASSTPNDPPITRPITNLSPIAPYTFESRWALGTSLYEPYARLIGTNSMLNSEKLMNLWKLKHCIKSKWPRVQANFKLGRTWLKTIPMSGPMSSFQRIRKS